jgi:hypothetical protein
VSRLPWPRGRKRGNMMLGSVHSRSDERAPVLGGDSSRWSSLAPSRAAAGVELSSTLLASLSLFLSPPSPVSRGTSKSNTGRFGFTLFSSLPLHCFPCEGVLSFNQALSSTALDEQSARPSPNTRSRHHLRCKHELISSTEQTSYHSIFTASKLYKHA